ncbi:MAG: chromate transporter [Rikenellaceae bacterium]
MLYLQLFWVYFKIGLFGFGGGYAMISLIQYEVVEHYQWLSLSEFTDVVAISQMTPGPIGINSATYIGYVTTGSIFGSMLTTFALCLPSFILVVTISKLLLKYNDNLYVRSIFAALRPTIVGLIAAAALLLMNSENFTDWKSIVFCAGAFALVRWTKIHPIWVICIAGLAGYIVYG